MFGGNKKGQKKGEKGAENAVAADIAKTLEEDEPQVTDYFKAMQENIATLERAVELKDDKNLIRRVWRKNTALRKNLPLIDLQNIVMMFIPAEGPARNQILSGIDAAFKKSKEGDKDSSAQGEKGEARQTVSLEVESYLHIFIVALLLERKCIKEALTSSRFIIERCATEHRRTMDTFIAKGYHYYARCNELLGTSKAVRPELIAAHRTACLQLNEQGQATLINLILRNYTESNLISEADTFDRNANFPMVNASNAQQIRYLYYMGKVYAIQADYSKANDSLTRARRKAPTNTGLGFRIAVHKLAICVQLLMGDIPDRAWFSDTQLKHALDPYFHLVKAVRNGRVEEYEDVLKKYGKLFIEDGIHTLMVRLRSSVIKTGLRNINLAYSKISFKDIASRLKLGDPMNAELVCAKAIRDRIIEAEIDGNAGLLISTETFDAYSTIEPKVQFNIRIQHCMAVHNGAVKAHRYPPNSHRAKKEKDDEGKVDEATTIEVDLEDAM